MDWTDSFAAAARTMDLAVGRRGAAGTKIVAGAKLMLPYILHPIPGMPTHWIWVNRLYRPIGTCGGWAVYEDYRHLHVARSDQRISRLIPACARFGFWAREDQSDGGLVLYDDFTAPWIDMKSARNYARLLSLVDYELPHRAALRAAFAVPD